MKHDEINEVDYTSLIWNYNYWLLIYQSMKYWLLILIFSVHFLYSNCHTLPFFQVAPRRWPIPWHQWPSECCKTGPDARKTTRQAAKCRCFTCRLRWFSSNLFRWNVMGFIWSPKIVILGVPWCSHSSNSKKWMQYTFQFVPVSKSPFSGEVQEKRQNGMNMGPDESIRMNLRLTFHIHSTFVCCLASFDPFASRKKLDPIHTNTESWFFLAGSDFPGYPHEYPIISH